MMISWGSLRLRTVKTRNAVSRATILSMVFKWAQSAEKHWRKLRGFKLLADVIDGVIFVDGEKQETENLDSEDRMSA